MSDFDSQISILSPLFSTFLIIVTRLYFKHAQEFTSIRKSNARQITRWMMYFTMLTDTMDQLRMLTTASPYYFLDYLFSWVPFYYDFKLFAILYSSVKLNKLFKKPKTDSTEIDLEKWQNRWIKNYVKWVIFWILYGIFHLVDLMVQLPEDDDSGLGYVTFLYGVSVFIFFSKQILKLCSGLFTTVLFKYLVKPFVGKNEEKIDDVLNGFENRIQQSVIFQFLQRIFHLYIKRWKNVKGIAKDMKQTLKKSKAE